MLILEVIFLNLKYNVITYAEVLSSFFYHSHMSTVLFAIAMFSSLHVLYIIRPTFGTMGAFFFFFSSVFIILGGSIADKEPIVVVGGFVATPCLFPGVILAITLIVFRRWLGYVWDVSLKIRPLVRLNYDDRGMFRKIYDGFKDFFNAGD